MTSQDKREGIMHWHVGKLLIGTVDTWSGVGPAKPIPDIRQVGTRPAIIPAPALTTPTKPRFPMGKNPSPAPAALARLFICENRW
jgi:hypothetical protein